MTIACGRAFRTNFGALQRHIPPAAVNDRIQRRGVAGQLCWTPEHDRLSFMDHGVEDGEKLSGGADVS